ncbi:outer membrane protein assembly factor BamD [Chryseobacterium sp. T1]
MKKYIIIALTASVILSCNSQMDRAMKSADKNHILQVANEKFAKKKWSDALALYGRLDKLVAGTDDAPNVVFNSAFANYYDKQYKLAAHQFKNFSNSFPQDPRKEEAAYMSALCYYEGSLDYNLDQSNTESAINELQDFLNNYGQSERAKNITQLIDELTYKLEYKAYENARQYYKMGEFLAADVAFDNVLDDFPATKLRPKIVDYIMRSKYELALNSIYDRKKDRIENALAYTKTVEKDLPNSEYSKTALEFRSKLEEEKIKFAKVQEDFEKRKAEIEAKIKSEQDKEENKDKTKQQEKEQEKILRNVEKTRRDSAKISSPDPNATFRIRR